MCALCLCYFGPWDSSHLAQIPQVLASSPVGILVKILCFQGRWLVNPRNTQTCSKVTQCRKNKVPKGQHSGHLHILPCNASLTLNYSLGWGWVIPDLLPSCTSTAPLPANPLTGPWANKNSGPCETLQSNQPACTAYVVWSGLFPGQRALPYKQKVAKSQWLSNSGTTSYPPDIIFS